MNSRVKLLVFPGVVHHELAGSELLAVLVSQAVHHVRVCPCWLIIKCKTCGWRGNLHAHTRFRRSQSEHPFATAQSTSERRWVPNVRAYQTPLQGLSQPRACVRTHRIFAIEPTSVLTYASLVQQPERSASERRETHAEHGADVAVHGGRDDPFLQAQHGLVDEPGQSVKHSKWYGIFRGTHVRVRTGLLQHGVSKGAPLLDNTVQH